MNHTVVPMPYQKALNLEITVPAKDDLQDIAQYTFAHHGERQMDNYVQALYDSMELLTKTPKISHRRNDMPEGYEVFNVKKHILVFTVKNNTVVYC